MFQDVFTIQPIMEISVFKIFYLYIKYLVVGLFFALIAYVLTGFPKREIDLSLGEVLIIPPIEEIVFRGIPLMFLGTPGIVFFHFVWAILHIHIPSIVFCLIHGLLEVRLWLGGHWYLAILIHLLHDLIFVNFYLYLKRRREKKLLFHNTFEDLVNNVND